MSRITLDYLDKSKIEQVYGGTSKVFKISVDSGDYFFKKNYGRHDSERVEKYFKSQFEDGVDELCADVVEVFSYHFLKEVGVDFCVPYKLAELDGENGCLSKSFITDGERMVSILDVMNHNYLFKNGKEVAFDYHTNKEEFEEFYEAYLKDQKDKNIPYNLSIEGVISDLGQYAKCFGFEFDENSIKKHLAKTMLLDYFMCNGDRNWTNIKSLVNEKNRSLSLAPLFDNGECFKMERMVSNKHEDGKVFFHLGSVVKLKDNTLSNNECVAKQIYSLCSRHEDLRDLLNKCLSLDMAQLITNVERTEDFLFTKRQKDVIKQAYSEQVASFKKFNPKLDLGFTRED